VNVGVRIFECVCVCLCVCVMCGCAYICVCVCESPKRDIERLHHAAGADHSSTQDMCVCECV